MRRISRRLRSPAVAQQPKPNILAIMGDDMAVSGKSLRDAAVHKSGMIPIFYVEAHGRLSG